MQRKVNRRLREQREPRLVLCPTPGPRFSLIHLRAISPAPETSRRACRVPSDGLEQATGELHVGETKRDEERQTQGSHCKPSLAGLWFSSRLARTSCGQDSRRVQEPAPHSRIERRWRLEGHGSIAPGRAKHEPYISDHAMLSTSRKQTRLLHQTTHHVHHPPPPNPPRSHPHPAR